MPILTNIGGYVVNITDNCNLKCKYCFSHANKKVISLDTLKQVYYSMDFTLPQIDLSLFGGEPLLHFYDIIKPFIEWLVEQPHSDKIAVGITSNATLINEEILRFLKGHNISFLLSLDGDGFIQEIGRPNSWKMVEPKLDLILKYYPDIVVRSTVFPENAAHLFEHNYLFLRDKGFRSVHYGMDVTAQWTDETFRDYMRNLSAIFYANCKEIDLGGRPPFINDFYQNIKAMTAKNNSKQETIFHRCGLGTTSVGISTKGDILACHQFNSYNKKDNPFVIGHLSYGISEARRKYVEMEYLQFAVWTATNGRCAKCPIENHCRLSCCIAENYSVHHNIQKVADMMCLEQQARNRIVKEVMNTIENQDKFLDFMFLTERNILGK